MKFKRPLVLVLVLALAMSAVTGGTIAWFTDEVTSANNVIKSGSLDVEMFWADGKEDPANANWKDASTGYIFNYDLWEPGYAEARHIKVSNEGTLALRYQLNIEPNGDVSKLADVIDVYYIESAAQLTGRSDLTSKTPVGTLAEMIKGMPANTISHLEAGEEAAMTIALKMQESAGNEYQNLAIGSDFAVKLVATQYTSESDSFDNQYDAEAELPTIAHVSTQEELVAALKSVNTIYLNAGEYTMPDGSERVDLRGKTVTIIGSKNAVIDASNVDMRDQFVTNANLTFNGVTMKFGSAEYMGFANPTNLLYKDCDISGLQYLSGGVTTFDNCDFTGVMNASGKPAYCVGTYTSKEVNFNKCTFDTDGKALLIYAESHFDSQVVNVKDCTFNATATATTSAGDPCAAIEIDASLIKDTYTLNLNGTNTASNKFNGLYRIKKQKDPANVTVNQNGTSLTAKTVTAATQADLNAAVASGDILDITLTAGSYTMPDGSNTSLRGKTLTISGGKDVVLDVSNVDERDQYVTGANLLFEGVTLNFGTVNYMGFANATTLTYKDCDINGLQFLYGPNVKFENCNLNSNGAEHCVWTWGVQNVSFDNCDFTYGDRAVNCYGEGVTTNASFTDCTFTKVAGKATSGAIETNSSALTALNLTITNCSVNEGDLWWVAQWDSLGGEKTTVNGVNAKLN